MAAATVPKSFNEPTAVQDFAAPGREIQCPVRDKWEVESSCNDCRLPIRRQMYLVVNGWTFSAIWGRGAYCTGARANGDILSQPPEESPDAEIAVWQGDGPMIDLGDDTVAGWVSPATFLRAVEAAEAGDEDGIRSALTTQEEA